MSNRVVVIDETTIQNLIRATEGLTLAVSALRREISEQREEEQKIDYWELVEDAAPLAVFGKEQSALLFASSEIEAGPPALPNCLKFLAEQRLSARGGGVLARAQRAWRSGFWARAALDTCTDYKREEELDLPSSHWIVLAAPGTSSPKRTTRKIDCLKLLKEAGQGQVWESFPSLTELQIFCAAARIDVPPLVRWKNSN